MQFLTFYTCLVTFLRQDVAIETSANKFYRLKLLIKQISDMMIGLEELKSDLRSTVPRVSLERKKE